MATMTTDSCNATFLTTATVNVVQGFLPLGEWLSVCVAVTVVAEKSVIVREYKATVDGGVGTSKHKNALTVLYNDRVHCQLKNRFGCTKPSEEWLRPRH